jgi:hypothetical protein
MNYSHPDDVCSRCKPHSAGFVPAPQQISKFFGLNATDLRVPNRSSQKEKNISEVYTEDLCGLQCPQTLYFGTRNVLRLKHFLSGLGGT